MKPFKEDVLVCDFEITEFDIDKGESIQVGLILLDKETLKQKWSYSSWIKPSQAVSVQMEGLRWASLDEKDIEEINKAPDLGIVAKEIIKDLPEKYILCAWNATFDYCNWNKLLKTVGMKAKTANILDLWSLAQLRLLNDKNYNGDYKSESVFQYLGADPRIKHYGIGDCEIEAMVLRKLMTE